MTKCDSADRAVLLTGGAGFLGSHVARALLDVPELDESTVVVLDDLSGGFRENIPTNSRVHFVEGSINDVDLVQRLFQRFSCGYVYHLAAYAAEGLSHFIRRFNYTNNLVGSINLINQAVLHDVKCLVFTSSIAVYGAAQTPMREDVHPTPEDPYGIAKYAVELDLLSARRMFGLSSVVFRPHNVYGEHQNLGDRYRNVVGIFMNQILRGEPMTIFGDGSQQRAFTYVGDIASLIAKAPFVPGALNEVFNIGADLADSVNELAAAVGRAMGVPRHPVVHLPAREEVHVAYADHTKCNAVFGRAAKTTLDAGLTRMADWSRKVGSRSTPPFANIEIMKRLPAGWL